MKLSKHCDLINEAVNFQTCLPYRSRASSVTSRLVRLTIFPASLSMSLSRYKRFFPCLPCRNVPRYLGNTRGSKRISKHFTMTSCSESEMPIVQYDQCPSHPELKLALLQQVFCLLMLLSLEDASSTHFEFCSLLSIYLNSTHFVRRKSGSCYKASENGSIWTES